jgi:hypothetical protein
MSTERLTMRQTREILRQKLLLRRSHRAIAKSVGVSAGVVNLASKRATAAGLGWEQIDALDDIALESHLYPSVALASERRRGAPLRATDRRGHDPRPCVSQGPRDSGWHHASSHATSLACPSDGTSTTASSDHRARHAS